MGTAVTCDLVVLLAICSAALVRDVHIGESMSELPVHFFVPHVRNFETLESLDVDRDWREFLEGPDVWVVQTYLRLRNKTNVTATNVPPKSGIVISHASQIGLLFRGNRWVRPFTAVSVRADCRGTRRDADFEIVQNPASAKPQRVFFVPFWPQPGLIKRSRARDSAIRRIGFKGFSENMHPYFRSIDWLDFLKNRDIEWFEDSMGEVPIETLAWNDYSSVDAIVAVRPNVDSLYPHKPSNKLVNAWLAGVPALLGPESAYRHLRQSPLDYLELKRPEDAKMAVRQLTDDPNLFEGMVENGLVRSRQFNTERVTHLWLELLDHLRAIHVPAARIMARPITVTIARAQRLLVETHIRWTGKSNP